MENLGIFYDHLVYFRPLEIVYGHLVYIVVIWYIFPRFGNLDKEKSGNPARFSILRNASIGKSRMNFLGPELWPQGDRIG
jgi:hypothetical protein